jgi:hypothetical protein
MQELMCMSAHHANQVQALDLGSWSLAGFVGAEAICYMIQILMKYKKICW